MVNRQRILHSFLSFFLLLTLLAGLLPGPFLAGKASAEESGTGLKGDVTQDGLVDGRDVLKLLRILESLDTPTNDESIAGDTYPLNETGERLTGDGQLTQDDAELLLRQATGLVSSGEISGDFSSSEPSIEKIEPLSGAPGTQVSIYGLNFIEGLPAENLVRFGDIAASIVSATGTKLVAEVPPDAESGYITVMTPGGQARSMGEFEVVMQLSGQVALPSGEDPAQFTIISPFGETAIDSSGSFTVNAKQDGLTFIGAAPKSGGENIYLNMLPPGDITRAVSDVEVNPLTTAKTLVWLQPQFLSDSETRHQELWDIMDDVAEVEVLAGLIAQLYPVLEKPLEDERIATALHNAITALFNALPEDYKASLNVTTKGSLNPSETTVVGSDVNIMKITPLEDGLKMGSVAGNPLDWIVWLHQLDEEDFPLGIIDPEILANSTWERTGYSDQTTVKASLWSAKMALVLTLVHSLMGLTKPDNTLDFSEAEDAVYILRAYSGTLIDKSPEDIDSEVIRALKEYDGITLGINRNEYYAIGSNLIQVMIDTLNLLVKVEGFIPGLVKSAIVGFETSYMQQFPYGAANLTASEIVKRSWIVVNDTLSRMIHNLTMSLKEASWKTRLLTVFKSALSWVSVLDKMAVVGKIGERVAGLAGTSVGALVGAKTSPTPLESAFIVTGDPFSPEIESFSPTFALGGTEVIISGNRFSVIPEENKVFFGTETGSEAAEVIAASRTELRVKVPAGKGAGKISVKTPAGSTVSENDFTILRTPILTGLSQDWGYAPSANFAGNVFTGTDVVLSGKYLSDGFFDDEVYFNGVKTDILSKDPLFDGGYSIKVKVPSGITGGVPGTSPFGPSGKTVEVTIVARETGGRSNTLPFLMVDAPILSEFTPRLVKGNDTVTIKGNNFPADRDMLKVRVEYNGEVVFGVPIVSTTDPYYYTHNRFKFYFPRSIDAETEGVIKVETPAGISEGKPFHRIAGLATGARIPVNTTSMNVIEDRKISLPEAVMFATGKADPKASPWDDTSKKTIQHWYQDEPVEGEEESWQHHPAEDEIIDLGHPERYEFHYIYEVKHPWPYDPDTIIVKSTPDYTFPLDERDVDKEEGDFIEYLNTEKNIGSGFADVICFDDSIPDGTTFSLTGPLVLDTGYDTIEGQTPRVTINGAVQLNSDGNTVSNINLTNPTGSGLTINGNANYFSGNVTECSNGIYLNGDNNKLGDTDNAVTIHDCVNGLEITGDNNIVKNLGISKMAGDGIYIDGGQANLISTIFNYGNGVNAVEITGGAMFNEITTSTYGYLGNGVYIHGDGTDSNLVQCNIGVDNKESPGNGVKIADGASFNIVNPEPGGFGDAGNRIENCGGDGILITGTGTTGNTVGGQSNYNQGSGVHITQEAYYNQVLTNTLQNGAHNILIDGNATYNSLENTISELNPSSIGDNACIRIIGDGNGSTVGNKITNCITKGGIYGLWVSGVTRPANDAFSSSLTVKSTMNSGSALAGCKLDDGTQFAQIEFSIDYGQTLPPEILLLTGNQVANNQVSTVSRGLSPGTTCIHITNGAHHNTILADSQIGFFSDAAYPDDPPTTGILIDKGANNNTVEHMLCDAFINNDAAYLGFGVLIDGAHNNYVSGDYMQFDTGIVVKNSNGNRIADALLIDCTNGISLNGAVNTEISEVSEGWIIPVFSGTGIRVTGSSSNITIQKTSLMYHDNGILVDGGSSDVSVGVAAFDTDNYISNMNGDGIVIQGPDTTRVSVFNNYVGINAHGEQGFNTGSGIVVKDGATDVKIGDLNLYHDNVLAWNLFAGVSVSGSSTKAEINWNYIGVLHDLSTACPNLYGVLITDGANGIQIKDNNIFFNNDNGILIQTGANHNTISYNLIQNNGGHGIQVNGVASLNNVLRDNLIFSNTGSGIRLSDGGNTMIPAPVIDEVSFDGGRIKGYIDTELPRGCVVDVYADTDDEGEVFLGSDRVYGNRFSVVAEIPSGYKLHALVTDPVGNTSEFGNYTPSEALKSTPAGYVFTSTRDGNPEIYISETGSIIPKRLTSVPAADYSPRLSPDGSQILFVSERSGHPEIWLMNQDGSQQEPLITDSESYNPAWSPDGSKFTFTSEKDGNPELYIGFIPGHGAVPLAYDDGSSESSAIEEGLSNIHAVHFSGDIGNLNQVQFYIHASPAEFQWVVLNWETDKPGSTIIAQGNTTPLQTGWHTVDTGNIEVPPDFVVGIKYLSASGPLLGNDSSSQSAGKGWVYLSEWDNWVDFTRVTDGNLMIRACPPPPDPVRLTENGFADIYPAWSPDGTRIAFTSDRSGNMDIWVMNADGSAPQQLTNNTAADYKPAWSPDGTRITFVSERDGNAELYTLTLADSSLTRLTGNSATDTDPAWTSDGSRIMFASDRQGGMELYSIAPTGLSLSRWTTSLGANSEPHLNLSGVVAKSRSLTSSRLPGSLYISSRPTVSNETALPAGGTGLTSPVRAEVSGATISVQSVVASPGTEVSVTVNLTGADDLGNLAFDLAYDGSMVTLLAVTPGEMLNSGMYAVNPENLPSNSGSLRFNWVTTAGYTGNGTVATLRFRVADGLDNGETIALSLSNLMVASRSIIELPRTGENGLITLFVQQAIVTGTTWEVNGTILGEVTLTLDGKTMVTSNASGSYQLGISTLGEHTIRASKAGYESLDQTVEITDLTGTCTLDFKGDNGLIPSAPDLSYVLACINKWSYPPSDGTKLEMPKVLAIINRWKYPILTNPD